MKKFDNFSNCLNILKGANFELATNDDIYRTGVIGQFNLTFELAWNALQVALRLHGVRSAEIGSPREILQLGYKIEFVDDSSIWLLMLKKRNTAMHIYNERNIDEMIILIRDSFIPAFIELEKTLIEKLGEVEDVEYEI
ncbi:MAG: HI0074 family nucleotidyltransferase substrate-binding subunit [Lachnospirales bacterium]